MKCTEPQPVLSATPSSKKGETDFGIWLKFLKEMTGGTPLACFTFDTTTKKQKMQSVALMSLYSSEGVFTCARKNLYIHVKEKNSNVVC